MDYSLIEKIKSDLYRFEGKVTYKQFLKQYIVSDEFKAVFWFRICHYGYKNKKWYMPFLKIKYRRLRRKLGMRISYKAHIGLGFKIQHIQSVGINHGSVIGNNFTIGHEVSIGDEKGKTPIIGDKVLLSPGVKAFGGIAIGDNVVVGANAVVKKSIPANSVAVGNPTRILDRPYIDSTERYYYPIKGKNNFRNSTFSK